MSEFGDVIEVFNQIYSMMPLSDREKQIADFFMSMKLMDVDEEDLGNTREEKKAKKAIRHIKEED